MAQWSEKGRFPWACAKKEHGTFYINLCMDTSGTSLRYVIVDRLGAFFYWTTFIWQQCAIRQYHCRVCCFIIQLLLLLLIVEWCSFQILCHRLLTMSGWKFIGCQKRCGWKSWNRCSRCWNSLRHQTSKKSRLQWVLSSFLLACFTSIIIHTGWPINMAQFFWYAVTSSVF